MVFLFDEFDTAAGNPQLDANFYGGLRSLSKYSFSYVIASRRAISDLQRGHPGLTSPFFNFLRPVHLTGFSDADIDRLLAQAEPAGFLFRVGDRAFVERYGGHHPYFVQAAAHYLFKAYAEGYLREGQPDERWVVERLRDIGSQQFRYYWDASDNGEKLILATLALVEQGDVAQYGLDQNLADRPPAQELLRLLYKRALLEDGRDGRPRVFSDLCRTSANLHSPLSPFASRPPRGVCSFPLPPPAR